MTAEITGEPVLPVQPAMDDAPDEAPYGYTTDRETGEKRPKKRPGRRPAGLRVPSGPSPALEDLQALGTVAGAPEEDRAPAAPPKGKRGRPPKAEEPLPPFRAGPIAKWVNNQYRRVGRVVRMMDYDIGTAIIACTRKPPAEDGDEDTHTTVGEAWENLAKSNPRVRRVILKAMSGGLVGEMVWAHAPIFLAIFMKESIRSRIPILGLVEAFMGDDRGEPDGEGYEGGYDYTGGMGGLLAGLRPEDMAQMMQMGQQMMGQMAAQVPRPANGVPRQPEAPAQQPVDGE